MTRWCAGVCGRELPLDRFRPNRGARRTECVDCARFADRTRKRRVRRRQPAKVRSANASYYRRHSERIRASRRARYSETGL